MDIVNNPEYIKLSEYVESEVLFNNDKSEPSIDPD
jgi:hypothetical protein